MFVSVTLERQVREVLDRFEETVAKIPKVMSGFLMTGGADYLLRAVSVTLTTIASFWTA